MLKKPATCALAQRRQRRRYIEARIRFAAREEVVKNNTSRCLRCDRIATNPRRGAVHSVDTPRLRCLRCARRRGNSVDPGAMPGPRGSFDVSRRWRTEGFHHTSCGARPPLRGTCAPPCMRGGLYTWQKAQEARGLEHQDAGIGQRGHPLSTVSCRPDHTIANVRSTGGITPESMACQDGCPGVLRGGRG